MVTEAVLQTLLTEMERVLNGFALTANSDDPHDLQPITPSHFNTQEGYLLTPTFVWKDRPVPSKNVEAGAISGGFVLEGVVTRVSYIIAS